MKMRYLYLFLKTTLPYALSVVFKRIKSINAPKETLGRTFFACNHASSFMDPLIPASINKPIVHFMTRADIYQGIVKHLFYHAHMIPIYRQHDGEGHNEKNEEIFQIVAREVKRGKNILVFAEGFTDDEFVRRLKPIKKGIARMAFFALEDMQWKEKVYIQAMGINYTDPGVFRSEVLMNYGDKICLNDYEEAYKQNPNRVIKEITQWVEQNMRKQITHVEQLEYCTLHENIMRLTRKGMNPKNSDFSIPLEDRVKYSQNLAHWINAQPEERLEQLKIPIEAYFQDLESARLTEEDVYEFSQAGKVTNTKLVLYNVFLAPFALLGLLHGWISWFVIKPKIEKAFKRKVFWSSVKMVISLFATGLYNALLLIPFYFFVYPSVVAGLLYLILISGPSFVIFHQWVENKREIKRRKVLDRESLKKSAAKRIELLRLIREKVNI